MDLRTYYRKYRPQKIFELDAAHIREGLAKILKSKSIPHAFLFSGPKGIGKTSAARLIAKSLNCQERKESEYEPCNKCEICREITEGSSLDIIEIDAASNRGIDDIRNLREKVKLATVKCRYKVYIIDEVHMLTNEAFNALLKTLEEPPAHVIFILCTTQGEKLPETIVSRCTQFRFHKAQTEEIVRALKRAIEGEKLKVEMGVLEAIAQSVDGSFRDAHKILEQMALEGKKITLAETKKLLGRNQDLSPRLLITYLAKNDYREALSEINRVVLAGADLGIYLQRLLEDLRVLLLEKLGAGQLIEGEGEIKDSYRQLAFSISDLMKLISLFSQAAAEMKTSPIAQLPLELAVITWCTPRGEKESFEKTETRVDPPNSPSYPSLDQITKHWSDFLQAVRPLNHSVEALLRAAKPIKLSDNYLTLEVFYKFHKERLESQKCREVIEQVIEEIFGTPLKVKYILGQKANSFTEDEENLSSEIAPGEDDIIKTAAKIFAVGKGN